jgi:hypothetical protein
MTLKECTKILGPLALALQVPTDDPTFRAYHRVLKDVPIHLLEVAVERAMRSTSPFMPKAGELLALAEVRRREIMDAHPYERCSACNGVGKVKIPDGSIPPRYRNCDCYSRYLARLEQLGISDQPLALPAAREGLSHVLTD